MFKVGFTCTTSTDWVGMRTKSQTISYTTIPSSNCQSENPKVVYSKHDYTLKLMTFLWHKINERLPGCYSQFSNPGLKQDLHFGIQLPESSFGRSGYYLFIIVLKIIRFERMINAHFRLLFSQKKKKKNRKRCAVEGPSWRRILLKIIFIPHFIWTTHRKSVFG